MIYLHGALSKFGGPFDMNVRDAADAVRALSAQIRGFRRALSDGYYKVIIGDIENGIVIDETMLKFRAPNHDIHFVPVPAGGKGAGKIILGVALVALAAFGGPEVFGATGALSGIGASAGIAGGAGITISAATVGLIGLGLVFTGISQLIAPGPVLPKQSYLFNNFDNVATQGGPVPLVYGRTMTGSVVITAGLSVSQFGSNSSINAGGDTTLTTLNDNATHVTQSPDATIVNSTAVPNIASTVPTMFNLPK